MGINNGIFQNDILNTGKIQIYPQTSEQSCWIILTGEDDLLDQVIEKFFIPMNLKIILSINSIKNAESLDPFLSKGIVDNPNEDGNNKNKDLMLNNFGIHHFHIGNSYEKDPKNGIRFTKRNNELLYALVKKDAVYFINIYVHDFPYKEHALEVIYDNWEFLLKDYEIKDLVDINKYSENDIKTLTKKHISTSLAIRGKSFIMNALTTSGHNGMQMLEQKNFINAINHIDTTIELQAKQILDQLNQALHQNLSSLNIGIVIKDGLLYFVEHQTEKTIVFRENEFTIANDCYIVGFHTFDLNS